MFSCFFMIEMKNIEVMKPGLKEEKLSQLFIVSSSDFVCTEPAPYQPVKWISKLFDKNSTKQLFHTTRAWNSYLLKPLGSKWLKTLSNGTVCLNVRKWHHRFLCFLPRDLHQATSDRTKKTWIQLSFLQSSSAQNNHKHYEFSDLLSWKL